MNHAARNTKGFTLVELLLSMSFIAVLLLAIAMTIVQIGTTYNRGITLKEINQTGRALSEDIRYNVTASQGFSSDTNSFLPVSVGGNDIGGRLCLGSFSYVWNYGRGALSAERVTFETAPANSNGEVYFVKVSDPGKIYCATQEDNGQPEHRRIRSVDTNVAQELLRKGDRELALHNFSVVSNDGAVDETTGQRLLEVSFTIGAGDLSSMDELQEKCLPPGNPDADIAYCALQEFTLVIRAGNRVN